MRSFRLYPVEARWWSFQDFGHVLDIMQRLQPKRVLEFGPGSSTLALIEGGADHVDCCEDDPKWFAVYRERLGDRYPQIVTMVPYHWADPVVIPALDGKRYDLGLVDGPLGTPNRPAAIEYCLQRCESVLAPCEDWSASGCRWDAPLPKVCVDLALKYGRSIEITETGPLSGSFALIGAPC